MRRIILFFLVLLSLFVGACSNNNGHDELSLLSSSESLASDVLYEIPVMERTVSLYYQIKNSDSLGFEKRTFSFGQENNECIQLINCLMNGPENDGYKPFNPAFVFDRVEVMSSVINVYFNSESEDYLPYEVYTLAFAVTNTLCDFTGVGYVNVYLDNHSLTYNEHPIGTLVKIQNSIGDELNRIEQMAENNEYYVTLYFLDENPDYIIPEVRLVRFTGDNYTAEIINQLRLGSDNPLCNLSVPDELTVIDEAQDVNNSELLNVDFNKLPYYYDERRSASIASICYSVLGFVKENSMQMTDMGIPVVKNPVSKSMYRHNIGQTISFYSINELNSSLSTKQITIMQNDLSSLDNVLNVFFDNYFYGSDFSVGDVIRNAYYSDRMLVVDFNACIHGIIDDRTDDEIRLFVYALVNTLTTLKDVNSVMLVIDGNRCIDFAGFINISEPLLMNPGLIK